MTPEQLLFAQQIQPLWHIGAGGPDEGPFGGRGPQPVEGSGRRGGAFHGPPGLLQSRASDVLSWLINRVPAGTGYGTGGHVGHIGVQEANQITRAARRGELQFDPTGMMYHVGGTNVQPGSQFYWGNFGINPNNPRQMAHAQRAIQTLQAIQAAHAARRQRRGGVAYPPFMP